MIINQENGPTVPDKTIACFPLYKNQKKEKFSLEDISLFLKPLNLSHKRDWFTSNFYHCLPLSIGNMQGFVFSVPYDFSVFWNGNNAKEDVFIKYNVDSNEYKKSSFIYPISEFGHGIFTIHFPLTLKTPPGVNLMTIAPPNFPLPGLSPMTGVIESDNLRFTFTLNIKLDFFNTEFLIKKDTPLIGIIPIPRYFCDSFNLKNAYEIFDKTVVDEEIDTVNKHGERRKFSKQNYQNPDKIYYSGKDIKNNVFGDHQLPKKNKI